MVAFKSLPDLKEAESLQRIVLDNNRFVEIPEQLLKNHDLELLMAGNRIRDFRALDRGPRFGIFDFRGNPGTDSMPRAWSPCGDARDFGERGKCEWLPPGDFVDDGFRLD
jgi:hypothetical protein